MSIAAWSGRLTMIGASAAEVSAITASYYAAPQAVRDALDQLIAGIANADLTVMLGTWRSSGAPFPDGFPGGGLPFGTGVAVLSGSPTDDTSVISAGTGRKVSLVGSTVAVGPPGVGANWRGAYSAGTTYAVGDGVVENGIAYISNVAGNIGNDPAADSGTHWTALVAVTPTSVITTSPQSSPVRITVGKTAPNSPSANDLWLSTSWRDVRVPPGASERMKILAPSQTWEQNTVAEPGIWYDGTNWNLFYSGNQFSTGGFPPALGWATCPGASDPLVAANWTKYASNPVIAAGAGVASNAVGAHSGIYYESGTVYIYYPGGGNIYVASGADPAHLSFQSAPVATGFTDGSSNPVSPINPRVFKIASGSYVMTFTYSNTTPIRFRAGYATATNPLGPFTAVLAPITSLDPVSGAGGTDGPVLALEGSTYIGFYHSAAVNTVAPTDIWRATSTDLQSWTILDNGLPFIRRVGSWERDQVADVFVVSTPNGQQLAIWDGFDNAAQTSALSGAWLQPALKRWDGMAWRPAVFQSDQSVLHGEGANESYGQQALSVLAVDFQNSLGVANSAFGTLALHLDSTGSWNTAVGSGALAANTSGNNNTAVGQKALNANATNQQCTAVGSLALQNATADGATAVGFNALNNLTTGASNSAVGAGAAQLLTTGSNNVASGTNALHSNVTGSSNTAVGQSALFNHTGSSATAVGNNAGKFNTTGTGLTAVGAAALQANTTGGSNTAVGFNALVANTTGGTNTAVGNGALQTNVTASSNTAVGNNALNASTGANNTAVGGGALQAVTTGGTNSAVGLNAGNTDGTTATDGTQSNMTLIGERAQATISNVIVLGKAVATRPNLIFGGVGASGAFGGGVGVFAIVNAATDPTSNPTGGGVLYASAGALKWRGSSGTVTTIAAA